MAELQLNRPEGQVYITENLLGAAAQNERKGKEIILLLLRQGKCQTPVTAKLIQTIASNKTDRADIIAMLLNYWHNVNACARQCELFVRYLILK
jgi:hypothetical protein